MLCMSLVAVLPGNRPLLNVISTMAWDFESVRVLGDGVAPAGQRTHFFTTICTGWVGVDGGSGGAAACQVACARCGPGVPGEGAGRKVRAVTCKVECACVQKRSLPGSQPRHLQSLSSAILCLFGGGRRRSELAARGPHCKCLSVL